MSEISAACREQDIGGNQVNQAIQQLDKVTQQNASASEQMSATSEELAAQAEQLQASIAYFRVNSDQTAVGERMAMPAARSASAARATAAKRREMPGSVTRTGQFAAARAVGNGAVAVKAAQAAVAKGFALKLKSADPHDAEFEQY